MDIRTRLPAEALAADPRLSVTYSERPVRLPDLPPQSRKVAVLQRPGAVTASRWRKFIARCLELNWVVVVESDDHPDAIAAVRNAVASPNVWRKFALCHAVQTSTERLREVFAAHNTEVKVFRNAVFDLPPLPEHRRAARVVFCAVAGGPLGPKTAARSAC